MGTLIGSLLGLNTDQDEDSGRVSLSDIESSLRSLTSGAQASASSAKSTALPAVGLAVIGLLATVYLRGRRRGRRQATVLEIRRV